MLAAGALVASLLAVGASPAGAVTDKADNLPAGKACVGDATNDQMFSDVSDAHAFKDHINCIAYYGITVGTGDGSTFSPNDTVPRWQMALFIARATGPGGVKLPAAADQGFTDIGGLFGEAQDAINQLAAAKIMAGKSATAFDPDGPVTRADMAVILVNYLDKASKDVRIESDGTVTLAATTLKTKSDDYFPDARAAVPREADSKISAAYELGITVGTTKAPARHPNAPYKGLLTSFNPGGHVNRGEMAAFITRTLNHTNARPRGVSGQVQDGRIIVSVRNDDFQPVSRARIDMVYGKTADKAKAFGVGGNCIIPQVLKPVVGKGCQIDATDPFTNTAGNVTMPQPPAPANPKDLQTVWIWTGKLEAGSLLLTSTRPKPFVIDLPPPTKAKKATQAKATDDLPADALTNGNFKYLRFGTAVTVTLQLQNVDSTTSVTTDVSEGLKAGVPAKWKYQTVVCTTSASTCPEANIVSKTPYRHVTSDDNGRATIEVPAVADYNPATTNTNFTTPPDPVVKGESKIDVRYVTVTVERADNETATTPASVVDGTLRYYVTDELRGNNHANRSDTTKRLVKATITPVSKYVKTAADAARSSQWATVKLTDQYGDPYSDWVQLTGAAASEGKIKVSGGSSVRVGCSFTGDPAKDVPVTREGAYFTDYLGEATIVYSSTVNADGDPDGAGTLRLGADVVVPDSKLCRADDPATNDVDEAVASVADTSWTAYKGTSTYDSAGEAVYFASTAGASSGGSALTIEHIDIANKTIVADTGTDALVLLTYDDNDQFATAASTFVDLAGFEKELAKRVKAAAAGTALGTVTWSNYGNATSPVPVSVTRITLGT